MKAASLCLLLGTLSVSFLYAQTDQGRLVGTVTDASGAIVPGAKIEIKNEKTGDVRTVTATDAGAYIVTNLPASTYNLVGSGAGLGPTTYEKVSLSVGQERIVNLILQPSSVQQSVTVSSGELATVDTSSARVGVNVSEREVAELPLNGRQVSQLYLLAPGAVTAGGGSFDNIRFSGRANQQNIVRFDGIEGTSIIDASPGNLNGETSSNFRLQTSLENIQEFRVDSNSYPAEYGTGTGGQISIVTKSGSNAFHGSLFEYLRNDAFDARNFFDRDRKSPLRLNQFGGSFGGPIKRDKTFFFLSYEGLRQRTTTNFYETTLSAAARRRAVPAVQPLLAAFPIGQFSTSNEDLDIVAAQGRGAVNEDAFGVRLDHRFNDKYSVYVRYFRDQGDAFATQNSTQSSYTVTAVPQNGVVQFQQVLSPTVINETKFGLNGAKTRVSALPPPVPGLDLSGVTINLTGSVALGGIAGQAGNAAFAIPTGLVRASSATNGRGQPYTNYSLSFIDNLSVIKTNHNMKFGIEVRPIRVYTDRLGGITYTYANYTDFLANRVQTAQILGDVSAPSPWNGGATGERYAKQEYYIGYAQDEWKVTPQLTLNYGLRYEYFSVLREDKNRQVLFNIVTGQLRPSSQDAYGSSPRNFGPRLALTYAPQRFNQRTVFRVGAGYYYGPGQTEDQIQPIESDRVSVNRSGAAAAFPLNINSIIGSFDINDPNAQIQVRAYAPGYRIPERILSYTASIQQQLPGNSVLTVAYVGSQGRNLFLRSIANKITGVTTNPTTGAAVVQREFGNRWAEIDYKTSGGTDHYDALQSTFNRRYSSGLSLAAQYTWAHSIGTSAGSNEAITAGNNYSFAADRGNNNFDVRHSFNLSALYDLPFGRTRGFGQNWNRATDAFLGGWQLGGIVNARSGLPIDVLVQRPDVVYRDNRNGQIYTSPVVEGGVVQTTAIVNTPGGGASRNVRRPNVVPGVNPYSTKGGLFFINPAAFSIPDPGTFGNLSRNALHGPNLSQLDLTLSKKFALRETSNIEFRAEFYNILNHTNFANPGNVRLGTGLPSGPTSLTNTLQPNTPFTDASAGGNFGTLNSTVSNQIGLGTNRQIQLSLRLNF